MVRSLLERLKCFFFKSGEDGMPLSSELAEMDHRITVLEGESQQHKLEIGRIKARVGLRSPQWYEEQRERAR